MKADVPGGPILDGGPSDAPQSISIIQPAVAYAEPDWIDVAVPAGRWTYLAGRDFQRAAFIVLREPGLTTFRIRSGTNPVAVPFIMATTDNAFVLRYVDFLTVVTGELFGFSAGGETVTVGTVRLN